MIWFGVVTPIEVYCVRVCVASCGIRVKLLFSLMATMKQAGDRSFGLGQLVKEFGLGFGCGFGLRLGVTTLNRSRE